jgi:hypothetical protein
VVCETGTTLIVYALSGIVGAGGTETSSNINAYGCSNVVAVITNQNQTANNPSFSTARAYTLNTTSVPTIVYYFPIMFR